MSDNNNNNVKLGTNAFHPVTNPEGVKLHDGRELYYTTNITNNLQQVIDFQTTCGHTVKNVSDNYIPTIKERKLRLNLILEELEELAESYGLDKYFINLKDKQSAEKHTDLLNNNIELHDTNVFNKIEALDANCDLEVVVLGAYCINGFTNIAKGAFKETMDSNMSKFCKTEDEALATVAGKDDWDYKVVNGNYVFVRKSDNKILKASSFFKPNYNRFFE
jgi:hypothetical protein